MGATILVSDDADGFKTIADEVGVQHQVCKAHVLRNTEDLIAKYQPLVAKDADGSLQAIGVSPQQATADLTRLGELVKSRQREQASELETMHRRYLQAAPPQEGAHQSLAYRLRLLFLDRWNLWHRLTRYRKWKGPQGETLDGTNNACERAIGWWIKERYRTMRGDIGAGACGARQSLPGLVWQLPQYRGWGYPGRALESQAKAPRDPHGFFLPDRWVPTIERSQRWGCTQTGRTQCKEGYERLPDCSWFLH